MINLCWQRQQRTEVGWSPPFPAENTHEILSSMQRHTVTTDKSQKADLGAAGSGGAGDNAKIRSKNKSIDAKLRLAA